LSSGPGIDTAVGNILRYGVIVSTVLVVTGLVLIAARPPADAPSSIVQAVSSGYGSPSLDIRALVGGLLIANPSSVLELGLIALVATPLARVVASIVMFVMSRDLAYVGITALVLGMLLVAIFIVGPAEK